MPNHRTKSAPDDSPDYVTACNKLSERLNHLHECDGMSWHKIAALPEYSCISPGMLWKIAKGYRPKGKTRELLDLPPTRVRIAADVTEEARQDLNDMAFELGMTFSEMMQALADGRLGLRWNR